MQNNLSLLIPAKAKTAHAELIQALGTENNPAQWLTFMQAVTKLMPEILKKGRPTAEAINKSVIGQLGFSSWQAMIEAPVSAGGLGWNVSAWRAWRRAWGVVQAYPWLLEAGLSSSEVNTLAIEQKEDFPQNLEAFEALKEGRSAALEHAKANAVANLKQQLKDAQTAAQATQAQAEAAQAEASIQSAINSNFAKKEQDLINELINLKTENAGLLAQAKSEKAKLLAQVKTLTAQRNALQNQEPIKLTRLQHFLAIFRPL